MKKPIYLINGVPGSGKSTVAKLLMDEFEFGYTISIDNLRRMVTSGISHPVPKRTQETERQFKLAYQSAAMLAKHYNDNGFAVAIEHVMFENEIQDYMMQYLDDCNIHKVFLCPNLETALERNRVRKNKNFDTSILIDIIKELYPLVKESVLNAEGWNIIDNTTYEVEDTINSIRSIK